MKNAQLKDWTIGGQMHVLLCGARGSLRSLFMLAKSNGAIVSYRTFCDRFARAHGKVSLADLSKPPNARNAGYAQRAKRNREMDELIKEMDARKKAMRP